jgi:hypothetical protein
VRDVRELDGGRGRARAVLPALLLVDAAMTDQKPLKPGRHIKWKNGLGEILKGQVAEYFKRYDTYYVRRDKFQYPTDLVRPSQIITD